MLLARHAALGVLIALALSGSSGARADTLYLKVDGVTGDAPESQPLGKGAFQLLTFTLSAEGEDAGKPAALKDVHFDMPVSAAAVQLFDLAVQQKAVPKASFVSVDDSGKARYRVDLEQVVVSNAGIQTLGTRAATSGDLGFQRIRITYGEGKDAVVTGWDRVKNTPWK